MKERLKAIRRTNRILSIWNDIAPICCRKLFPCHVPIDGVDCNRLLSYANLWCEQTHCITHKNGGGNCRKSCNISMHQTNLNWLIHFNRPRFATNGSPPPSSGVHSQSHFSNSANGNGGSSSSSAAAAAAAAAAVASAVENGSGDFNPTAAYLWLLSQQQQHLPNAAAAAAALNLTSRNAAAAAAAAANSFLNGGGGGGGSGSLANNSSTTTNNNNNGASPHHHLSSSSSSNHNHESSRSHKDHSANLSEVKAHSTGNSTKEKIKYLSDMEHKSSNGTIPNGSQQQQQQQQVSHSGSSRKRSGKNDSSYMETEDSTDDDDEDDDVESNVSSNHSENPVSSTGFNGMFMFYWWGISRFNIDNLFPSFVLFQQAMAMDVTTYWNRYETVRLDHNRQRIKRAVAMVMVNNRNIVWRHCCEILKVFWQLPPIMHGNSRLNCNCKKVSTTFFHFILTLMLDEYNKVATRPPMQPTWL